MRHRLLLWKLLRAFRANCSQVRFQSYFPWSVDSVSVPAFPVVMSCTTSWCGSMTTTGTDKQLVKHHYLWARSLIFLHTGLISMVLVFKGSCFRLLYVSVHVNDRYSWRACIIYAFAYFPVSTFIEKMRVKQLTLLCNKQKKVCWKDWAMRICSAGMAMRNQ